MSNYLKILILLCLVLNEQQALSSNYTTYAERTFDHLGYGTKKRGEGLCHQRQLKLFRLRTTATHRKPVYTIELVDYNGTFTLYNDGGTAYRCDSCDRRFGTARKITNGKDEYADFIRHVKGCEIHRLKS